MSIVSLSLSALAAAPLMAAAGVQGLVGTALWQQLEAATSGLEIALPASEQKIIDAAAVLESLRAAPLSRLLAERGENLAAEQRAVLARVIEGESPALETVIPALSALAGQEAKPAVRGITQLFTEPSASKLRTVSIGTSTYHLSLTAELRIVNETFRAWFGDRVTLQDFIDVFETDKTRLTLESLEITPLDNDRLRTRATFHNGRSTSLGYYVAIWHRDPSGSLIKTEEATLDMGGASARKGLRLQANLADFSRKTGIVREFRIQARQVGRYAYRFMDGMIIENDVLGDIRSQLAEHYHHFSDREDSSLDEGAMAQIASPHELADFLILRRIGPQWMDYVSGVIERHGYNFTVDQVVDVARRPGLVFLIDRKSYIMRLDLRNGERYRRYMQSIDNAIARKTLLRIRGVLGASFHHLSPSVRNALITFRPYLFPQPRRTPEIPDLSFITIPESGFPVTAFRAHDGKNVPVIPRDPPEFALRDYRRHEVQQVVAAIDDGMEVVSATGLSGSGKTEGLIWNLERELAARGHRVVALDVMRISHALTGHGLGTLLDEIDDAIRPTVFIFDESVYFGDGKLKEAVVRFTDRFLRHRGNHLIFVGGGTISPEKKRRLIEERLFVIWDERRTAHVTLFPKPINLHQAYRFLGLARIHWMSEEEKVEFLQYLFERIPPFFVMYMNLRLHEHPEITTLAQAKAAVDEEVDPRFWREAMGTISS